MPAEQVNEEAEQPMYFQVQSCILCLKLRLHNNPGACSSSGQHSPLEALGL